MTHPVVRWQIVSPDAEATIDFYGKLFGWRGDRSNALGYRQVAAGGEIEGGVWPGPEQERPFVQLFIAVPDVEQHVKRAVELGAEVVVPTSVLPDGDTMAVLVDPVGLPFGVCKLRDDARQG